MSTETTSKELTKEQARAWLDGRGLVETRLPRKSERLEIVNPDYSQFDMTLKGSVYTLFTTKIL